MPTTFSVDFSGDGNASAGAAGTTTGAGHGIIDTLGGRASRASGALVIENVTGQDFSKAPVFIPVDQNSEQSITVRVPANSGSETVNLGVRVVPAASNAQYHVYYSLAVLHSEAGSAFGDLGLWHLAAYLDSTGYSDLGPDVFISAVPGYVAAHEHDITLEASGANPTTLHVVIRDVTAGVDRVNYTTTDSSANNGGSLQGIGKVALFPNDYSGYGVPASGHTTGRVITIDAASDAGNPLVVPIPVVTARTSGATSLSITPSGGTAPYSYQWHRVKDSINWTAGSGDAVSGQTNSTFVDTGVLPGEIWTYRCVVTDSGTPAPQSLSSNYLLTEAAISEPVRALKPLPNGVIIVEIGDSITAGGTPGISMASRLTSLGVTVHHSNQGHSSSQLVLEWDPDTDPAGYIAAAVTATTTLKASYPGALVIWSMMLGTNDARNNSPTPSQYQAGLEKVRVVASANGAVLVVNHPSWMEPGGCSPAAMDLLISYRGAIRAASDGVSLLVGDLHALPEFYANRATYFGADPVHPNSTGADSLGALWADAVARGALAGADPLGIQGGGMLLP